MEKVRMGVIGCGNRGYGLLRDVLLNMSDVEVVAVCDNYEDRTVRAAEAVEKKYGYRPFGTTDYMELLRAVSLDAVLVSTYWETHVEVAIDAMKAGVAVALEVGGAYSVEKLWEMVRVQESTGVPLMMMENCCFGKTELLATSLLRNGLLGELVHAHGCYGHCLQEEIAGGDKNRHYRLRNYMKRNCENYPTHELGPIAKALGINRGNRMVSLVSVASKAVGMKDYINRHSDEYPELVGKEFRQGDIVNTIITCADGSTITLRLDTTLPRSYAREFTLRGTRGLYEQATNSVFLDGDKEYWETDKYYKNVIGNAERYEEKYLPAVWKDSSPERVLIGHGGMDGVEFRVFVDALKNGSEMPIDVYDAAAWMCITALSEASVAAGGMPQAIPDFTGGMWTLRPLCDVVPIPVVE